MPRKHRTLLAVATAVAVALSPMNVASAQAASQKEPALGTGVLLNTTMDHTVGVTATFNPAASRTEGMSTLKRLRGEMWDKNPPFVDTGRGWNGTLRDAARSEGLTTKDAYVNAAYSDPAMVPIAVQRAVEESVAHNERNHDRPYNQSCLAHSSAQSCKETFSATFNGERSWGENLAWGHPSESLEHFIYNSWGYGEYQDLLQSGGRWNFDTGHLWILLSPSNYGYGFAHVTTQGGQYPVAASTAVSHRKQPRQDQSLNQKVTRTMYRPAAMHETPTGQERITLREGTALPIQHTAELWGGTSQEWIAPEVKADTKTYAELKGTYPDGATTTERIPVLILNKDADKVTPAFSQPQPVREGLEVTATLINGHEIPRGTYILPDQGARISPDGVVTWRTPNVDKDQDLTITVTFTYPDKSSNTATINVPVRDSMSDQHEPTKLNKQFEVREGLRTTIALAPIIAGLPAGTKVSSTSGQVSGTTLTYTGESVDADMVLDVPITVTYPDGSTDTTSVSVLVIDQLSDQFTVTYPATTVDENSTATISPEFSQPLPPGTSFSLVDDQAGVSIDSMTGEVTYTVDELSGHRRVTLPVDVTYSDTSTSRVNATVQLNDLTPPASSSSNAGPIIGGFVAAIAALAALVGLAQQLGLVNLF